MKKTTLALSICGVLSFAMLSGCTSSSSNSASSVQSEDTVLSPQNWQPSHVEIRNVDGHHQLYVNNELFVVKGAGVDFTAGHNYEALVAAGGNSFRTWSSKNLAKELEFAEKHNLMIAVGLDVDKELHGFNYDDEAAVKAQFEHVKKTVDTYKNHPNILTWVVGNELNLLMKDDGTLGMVNPKVYQAASDIIDYIHQVDPHHPVTYTFAGVLPEHIHTALSYTPQVDFVSVQVYQDLQVIPERMAALKIDKPYMITEYGPVGHWEVPATEWGREIEQPSAPKARGLADRIKKGIVGDDSGYQIGSFVFLWGQKQERTPTWYGLFNKDGNATARVDEMTKHWTGQYPENRAPLTESISLNNQQPSENIYLIPNQSYTAKIEVSDPNGDPLTYQWVLQKEVDVRSQGGAFEQEPDTLAIEFVSNKGAEIEFVTPEAPGDYRLYAYAFDGKGKVGNANVPFYVK